MCWSQQEECTNRSSSVSTTTSDGAYKAEMLVKRLAVGAKTEGDAILLLFLQTQSSNGTNDIKLVKVIKGELKPL
ncbi:hypothetical protein M3Y98_00731900 [Aphelenchoides besseyi]|nr:hypothetical protein M3Y98_00731900 [Aphelenchoides besseyi]